MEMIVSSLLAMVVVLLAIPVMVFFIEAVAGIVLPPWQRTMPKCHVSRRRVAALVPAHNESTGLLPTLADIRSQLLPGDRLLVVADNCDDDTAAVAFSAGAEVVERHDPAKRGKGYALDCGLHSLSSEPPDIVIVVDADCRLAVNAIDRLATTCAITHRPVQALYLMTAPDKSEINYQVAEFAWRVKNWLRPLGLSTLKLPCQLVGTGMAFPWHVLRSVDLVNGWLVEDIKLGLDLALAGHPPLFCPSACVMSQFASSAKGAEIQRKRWEQGHINTIVKIAPRLLQKAIVRRDWGLLALALDIAVPPLSLLTVMTIGTFAFAAAAAFFGLSSAALTVSLASVLMLLLAIVFAWLKCGRDVLPACAIFSIVSYVFKKLSLYRHILSNRTNAQWIRTDRTKSG